MCTLITKEKYLIKHSPQVIITKETELIHKINQKKIDKEGQSCLDVLTRFCAEMAKAQVVISHGAKDDLKVLLREAAGVQIRLPMCKVVHCTKLWYIYKGNNVA